MNRIERKPVQETPANPIFTAIRLLCLALLWRAAQLAAAAQIRFTDAEAIKASNEANVFITEPISKTVSPFTFWLVGTAVHWQCNGASEGLG
jgi:hypothetical protein